MPPITSKKDVKKHMLDINKCLEDFNNDWNSRLESIKRIRSLLIVSNESKDDFVTALKHISNSFQMQLKDKLTQVVREACIIVAYLSLCLGEKSRDIHRTSHAEHHQFDKKQSQSISVEWKNCHRLHNRSIQSPT